jgi:hypothetical protein
VTVAEISVSEVFEITKLLEMLSSFAGTPGQTQLVVIASVAETYGIGASVKTSVTFMAPSLFTSLPTSLLVPLSITSKATHTANVATTMTT